MPYTQSMGDDNDDEDSNDFPVAPPVVTEMNPMSDAELMSGGGAYLDDDDDDDEEDGRGGLPPLPQFVHDLAAGDALASGGGGLAGGLNTNQIEPIVGPDGSKGLSVCSVPSLP